LPALATYKELLMTDLTLLDSDSDDFSPNLHRIERSSVIEQGRYWRCLNDTIGLWVKREGTEFKFRQGFLYLLTRLEYFDGKLHSVVLLDDPARGQENGILTLNLFLRSFEQVEDGAATEFRNKQIATVQDEAAEVQKEMAEAQVNPALMQSAIEEGLKEWERELARNRNDDEEVSGNQKANLPAVTTNGRFDLTAAIGHKIGPMDVAVFRHMAQREGKIAEIRGKWLQTKVKKLGEVLNKLTPFFSEHAAVGLARAQDALDLAKDVEKGLRSLRLYTGEGVEVKTILEGESAPAHEPLTVYQTKLYMEEEFAVWDDVDRLFDYTHSDVFFKALAENESLRQQLIPAQRGVVAMAVCRRDVDYDAKSITKALAAGAKNRENKALFLLVRDGGNWYQVWSDEPSHELSPRLFPTRNEMDQVFSGIDGETVGFEDLRFTNRATEFARKSLVYKRFLILACGLDHRLKLFGHFYPDSEALSFISMRFQSDYMRFIADADGDAMLGDNVGSVHQFIRYNHSQLAAGCRVLVFGKEVLQQPAAPGAFSKGTYNRRAHQNEFYALVKPQEKANLLTVHRDKEDLVVYLPVERIHAVTYSGYGTPRHIKRLEFEVRVALNKLEGEELGYLLTDIVKAEELRPYIYSRRTRASHLAYLYGFKLAMKKLRVEEDANSPILAQLQERATTHYGLAATTAETAKLSAIQTWREKNPKEDTLPSLNSPLFAALDFELAEAAYAYTHAIPAVERHIANLGGQVLRVMRAKKGALVVYYKQPEAERDLRIHSWQWVGRRTFTAAGKPTKDAMQSVWLRKGRIVGESELLRVESPLFQDRVDFLALPKLREMLDKTAEMADVLSDAFKGERQGVSDRAWLTFTVTGKQDRFQREEPAKQNQSVLLPVGVSTALRTVLGIRVNIYDLLYHYGSDAQRAVLMEKGYELPRPRKDRDGAETPDEGINLSVYVDGYGNPEGYTGPVGTEMSLTFSDDYHLFDYEYKGERRLDHSLNLAVNPKKQKGPHSSSSGKSLDIGAMWFPAQYRAATGEFQVSSLFPGLLTA
jgi:hypothetical protein